MSAMVRRIALLLLAILGVWGTPGPAASSAQHPAPYVQLAATPQEIQAKREAERAKALKERQDKIEAQKDRDAYMAKQREAEAKRKAAVAKRQAKEEADRKREAERQAEQKAAQQKQQEEQKKAQNPGRQGRQERLKELAVDPKVPRADRGWIKNEQRQIEQGNRTTIRNPSGRDLAHERGREAAKGYSYEHSNLQDRDLHRLQHKHDDGGRKNKERPAKP